MKENLLFAVIFGFLAGVFARSFLPLGPSFAYLAFLLAFTAAVFAFTEVSPRLRGDSSVFLSPFLVIAVSLAAFGGGILRMNSAVLVGDPELTSRLNEDIILEGIISDEPDMREDNIRISLGADKLILPDKVVPIRAGVLVVASRDTSVKYGDLVKAEGALRLPRVFDTGLGRQFSYPEYLAKDGIGYELAFANVEKAEGDNEANPLKAGAIWIKQKFLEGLGLALSEPEAGLAGGITVGAKRGLGKDLSGTFITVGLIHIVVLSGYNIMLVINGALKMFSRAPRLFKLFLTAFIAISFALMTGGASSSVRAAAMAVIGVVGRATGRLYFASRVLGIVAFGMVVWNPFLLSFDIGFQLSVLATLGLIWFTPVFSEHLKWITEKFHLREIAATTLGTQLAVLPLLLYQNGHLPLFSLPANLLALIAIPPAMAATTIASIAGLVTEPIATIIALPAYILLSYIIDVAKFFASLPFASVAIGAFSAWWMFLTYAVMFGGLAYIKKRTG